MRAEAPVVLGSPNRNGNKEVERGHSTKDTGASFRARCHRIGDYSETEADRGSVIPTGPMLDHLWTHARWYAASTRRGR